jgi:hypothetical protein
MSKFALTGIVTGTPSIKMAKTNDRLGLYCQWSAKHKLWSGHSRTK